MKPGKILTFSITVLCLLGIASTLTAQPQPGAEEPSPDVQAKSATLEKQYEVLLRNALTDYYEKQTFLVDATIDLSRVRYPTELKKQETLNRPLQVDRLPGLPILPEGFTRSVEDGDTLRPSKVEIGYKIERLNINVTVDTSYSNDDIDFVNRLVSSTASINPMRGDQVRVQETVFPRTNRGLQKPEEKKAAAKKTEPDTAAAAPPTDTEQAIYQKYLPHILIGLAALLLLFFVLLIWMNRRTQKNLQEQIPSSEELLTSVRDEVQKISDKEESKEQEDGEPTEEEKAQYERDLTYVTTQFISNPEQVGEVLEEWIENDEDDGVWKAARALKASNTKLLSTLKPVISTKHYESLQHSIDDMEDLSFEEKKNQTRQFRKDLEEATGKEETKETDILDDIFSFLKQLTDEQLLHLLKDESDNVAAIALAQLDPDRSARILKRMDEDRHTKILIKMGNLRDAPIETYKQVARHLSNKALDVINMKSVPADGVQSILSLIDQMSIDEQEEYVNSIAESDIELANKVRQYFVAFSDIPSVEDELLQSALDELETDTIVTAMTNVDSEIYEKIMEFRPSRERQLIESELKAGKDVTRTEIERARKKILKEIRKQKSAE